MPENRESKKKNTYTHTHAQNRRVSDTPSLRPEEQKIFFTKNHKPKCSSLVASYKILKNTTTSPLSPTASLGYPRERIIGLGRCDNGGRRQEREVKGAGEWEKRKGETETAREESDWSWQLQDCQ